MKNSEIKIKTKEEIKIMAEGGKRLGEIKGRLKERIDEKVSAAEIENLAVKLIKEAGGKSSFKTVPGYHWATCININEGVVHGIPGKEIVFKKGDIVSVDIGLFYQGFHTDTSTSCAVNPDRETELFLEKGKEALQKAINKATIGNRVYDISKMIQETVEAAGHKAIRALVGHGIGRTLHEPPQIPCFVKDGREQSPLLSEGAVLAIEVMYTKGNSGISLGEDGWTIRTQDGKIAGFFEETVAVTSNGPLILTAS